MVVSHLPISNPNTTPLTTQGHMLLLSRYCYLTFGPSYYSHKQLRLASILPFADTVLANANPLFARSIRKLSLLIDEESIYAAAGVSPASSKELISREVSRLITLLKCYPELADGLESVEVMYGCHTRGDFYVTERHLPDVAEVRRVFGLIERDNNQCFTKFKDFMVAKIMKDPTVHQGFAWMPFRWPSLRLESFSLRFRKA